MCQVYLQGVSVMVVSKNELCEFIDSNVPIEFNDTKHTIRYEPVRDTKVLQADN